jgi:hypothetical protein
MNGDRRLRLAQSLTQSRERIVKQSANQLFQKRPDVVSPGGNAYGEEMTATCLRDAESAVLALEKAGCDMHKLSMIGKDYQTSEHVRGFLTC